MIESNWRIDLGQARELWRKELEPYEPELGVKALAYLSKRLKWINLSDLVEVLRMFDQTKGPVGEQRSLIPPAVPGKAYEVPQWYFVWNWCRNSRDPRENRPFPQQQGFVDSTQMLTMDEYEVLHQEWVTAGRPKHKTLIPVMKGKV
jgi:hypothetical protein